jgi:hypothetical protein
MNYSIQFTDIEHPYMSITPRRKSLKHTLLHVTNGLVLYRLGKLEYALRGGQSLWVPANCLISYTIFPTTVLRTVDVSQRLPDAFPAKVGLVTLSELASNVLEALSAKTGNKEYRNALLKVIRYELPALAPTLELSAFSDQINRWSISNDAKLSPDLVLLLRLREARKQLLSGQQRNKVANELLGLTNEEFSELSTAIFGHEL